MTAVRRWIDRDAGTFVLMRFASLIGLLGAAIFGVVKLVQRLT